MSKILKYDEIIAQTIFLDICKFKEISKKMPNGVKIPEFIIQNLANQLRPYQIDALENLLFINHPEHLKLFGVKADIRHNIFHMATGSGKTMEMACVILYLYSLGYRKFLFLTQSLNLIEKTKNNLLPERRSKKLEFNHQLFINGKNVDIKEVDGFSDNEDSIEICFKTVHSIHNEIQIPKENSIDFSKHKTAILADEAHHFQANQKGKKNEGDEKSWESSISHILNSNKDNRLYEFTATLELKHSEIHEKYKDKIVYDYPLLKFRKDGYSKEVELIRMPDIESDRVLMSLITSQYRMHIASEFNIPLVPRVLFKSQGTIEEIGLLKTRVLEYISSLDLSVLNNLIKKYPQSKVLQFFQKDFKTDESKEKFIRVLKSLMTTENMISIHSKNSSKEKDKLLKELNQIDELKHIRLVFAINILNEGWDVLSLYDIVKMDKINSNPKETTAESQLIGRGARQFPYVYQDKDKYKRKFDGDHLNKLRLLEEMNFYSVNDNKYIEKLKESLVEIGLQDLEPDEIKDVKTVINQRKKLEGMLTVKGKPKIFTNKLLGLEENIKHISDYFKGSKNVLTLQFDLQMGIESLLDSNENIASENMSSVSLKDLLKNNEFIFQRVVRKVDLVNKGRVNYKNYQELIDNLKNDELNKNLDIQISNGIKGFNELSYDDKFKIILKIINKISEYVLKYKGKMYGSSTLDVETYIDDTFKEYTKSERFCLEYGQNTQKEFHLNALGEPLKGKYRLNNAELFYYDKATWDSEPELELLQYLDHNIPADQRQNILIIRNENEHFKVYSTDTDINSDNLGKGFCPDLIVLKRVGDILEIYFIEVKGRTDTEEWKKLLIRNILKGKEKTIDGVLYRIIGIDEFYTQGNTSLIKNSGLL